MSVKNFKFVNILFSTILVETIAILIFRLTKSKLSVTVINDWYDNLKWTAIILDILIVMIGFYLNIFVCNKFKIKNYYLVLLSQLIIQIIHDFIFALVVNKSINKNNKVMDEFKKYIAKVNINAIIGDSWMYMIGVPLLFKSINLKYDTLIFSILLGFYIIGYMLYQKPLYKFKTYNIEFIFPLILNLI